MAKNLRRLGFACLAACFTTPAAGQYGYWSEVSPSCSCRSHDPLPQVQDYRPRHQLGYDPHAYSPIATGQSFASGPSSVRVRTHQVSSQYYTPEDAQVLYHPVVVPLEEFLSPRQPIALTPEQLARQQAAAAARATPAKPAQAATQPATAPEADPFTDDTPASGEAASATGAPPEDATEEPAAPAAEDTSAEESMPAEQPETESTPDAEASPESEPADASEEDPFNSP